MATSFVGTVDPAAGPILGATPAVPEPSSLVLLGTGLTALAARFPSTSPDLPLFTDAIRAIKKMQEAGVSQADIVAVARLVAYNTAVGIVGSVDRGRTFESGDGAPGWKLMETNAEGDVTGRDLVGLYENLLEEDRIAANEIQR